MLTQSRNWLLILLLLITACSSFKKLPLTKIPQQEIEDIVGTYEWANKGHYGKIHIDPGATFKYEFSNSGNKGYRLGTYSLEGVILILVSDSLISGAWIDSFQNKEHRMSRIADSSIFEFVITEKGLHDKATTGHFYKEATYIKR